MKDNRLKGIIALAIVTVIAFGVIYGSKALSKDDANTNNQGDTNNKQEDLPGVIEVGDQKGIKSAREITDDSGNITGYAVTSSAKGFIGDVVLEVSYDKDARTINNVTVVSQTETPDYGGKMTDADYLSQFLGITAPVTTKAAAPSGDKADADKSNANDTTGILADGTYSVASKEAENGYLSEVTLVVESGKIVSIVWDAKGSNGEYKSYLSSVGEYVMTEDGLTWKEQADALAASVIEKQSLEGIVINENGKTDTVAGVSIGIGGFTGLVEEALQLAASGSGETSNPVSDEPSHIDALSGATYSSDAIVEAINIGYEFISSYAK